MQHFGVEFLSQLITPELYSLMKAIRFMHDMTIKLEHIQEISKSPVSRKLQFICSKVYQNVLGIAMVTSASELLMTILDCT